MVLAFFTLFGAACSPRIRFVADEVRDVTTACPATLHPFVRRVLLDESFTISESATLKKSMEAWRQASYGAVDYTIVGRFERGVLPDEPTDAKKGDIIRIFRVANSEPYAGKNQREILGRATSTWIVIFIDRVSSVEALQGIAMHEIGHTMGISHIPDANAVMHDVCISSCSVPQLTVSDIIEYCRVVR